MNKIRKVDVRVSDDDWINFRIALLQHRTNASRLFSSFVIRYGRVKPIKKLVKKKPVKKKVSVKSKTVV